MVLLAISETMAARLRKDAVKAEVIAIGIKDYNFSYASHQRVLSSPTDITKEIPTIASELFDELWNGSPIRHLGIHTSRIKDYDFSRQLSMFDNEDYEKLELADEMVDSVRDKYGIDSIKRAIFLSSVIDHMSGGISREKRTVDYTKLKIDNC